MSLFSALMEMLLKYVEWEQQYYIYCWKDKYFGNKSGIIPLFIVMS